MADDPVDAVSGVILDGSTDIARRLDGETMKVEVPGRKKFQMMYMKRPASHWNGHYDPEKHGPSTIAAAYPKSVRDIDLHPSFDQATEFLEVGLVFGTHPSKYQPKDENVLSSEAFQTAKKARLAANLPRASDAVRVFAKRTHFGEDGQKSRIDFFVGRHVKANAPLEPIHISRVRIFYYSEFWDEVQKLGKHMPVPDKWRAAVSDALAKIELKATTKSIANNPAGGEISHDGAEGTSAGECVEGKKKVQEAEVKTVKDAEMDFIEIEDDDDDASHHASHHALSDAKIPKNNIMGKQTMAGENGDSNLQKMELLSALTFLTQTDDTINRLGQHGEAKAKMLLEDGFKDRRKSKGMRPDELELYEGMDTKIVARRLMDLSATLRNVKKQADELVSLVNDLSKRS